MANRLSSEIRAIDKALHVLPGSYAPNGVNPLSGVKGTGFTAARTGVGKHRITLTDRWPDIQSVTATLQLAADDLKAVRVDAIDVANKTIDLVTYNTSTGAAADVAANANNRVNFVIWTKNSTVKP